MTEVRPTDYYDLVERIRKRLLDALVPIWDDGDMTREQFRQAVQDALVRVFSETERDTED